MLVLSRKIGEEIIVDGNIRIIVNRISGSRVSLAIEAPGDVRVMRGELQPEQDNAPFPVHPGETRFTATEYVNRVG